MNVSFHRIFAVMSIITASTMLATQAPADPLPGRDLLKFQQKPMIATSVLDNNGVVGTFLGHDEQSTAYGFVDPSSNTIQQYQGRFMADDFADKLSTPVVHVKWWGSYHNDVINPAFPVNKFLISFESDVPGVPAPNFSHPGQPLLNQVVSLGPLAPGSGTYTEKLIRGPDPLLNESLYEYNAELHLNLPFPEIKDTVYWLKITAMVDVPPTVAFDPFNPPPGVTQWGWHNRDYTIQDTLASTGLASPPGGEVIEGFIGPANQPQPVWHFQDDAIFGDVRIVPGAAGFLQPTIFQPVANMVPQRYLDGIDGPAGPIPGALGIGNFSKDLAFELYTTQIVPEPATCLLLIGSSLGLALTRRRRRGRGKQWSVSC